VKTKNLAGLLLMGIALLWVGGCADLDLDTAYKHGNLSAADYYRLKSERAAQRNNQMFLQQQASQQRQNQIMSDYTRNINNAPATPMFNTPFLPTRPQGIGVRAAPAQQQPKLPSALDVEQMQKGEGLWTGRTQSGQDGKVWYEHRTLSGSTYWELAR